MSETANACKRTTDCRRSWKWKMTAWHCSRNESMYCDHLSCNTGASVLLNLPTYVLSKEASLFQPSQANMVGARAKADVVVVCCEDVPWESTEMPSGSCKYNASFLEVEDPARGMPIGQGIPTNNRGWQIIALSAVPHIKQGTARRFPPGAFSKLQSKICYA